MGKLVIAEPLSSGSFYDKRVKYARERAFRIKKILILLNEAKKRVVWELAERLGITQAILGGTERHRYQSTDKP